jgi:hypothetical protein
MLDIVKSGLNGNGAISGRGLRRRKLTIDQRVNLAADLVSGQRQLVPSFKYAAALLRTTPTQVRERLKWRVGEPMMMSDNIETPRLVSVMNGGSCVGFLIRLGPRGVEAFDADENALGIFPDALSATAAIEKSGTSRGCSMTRERLPNRRAATTFEIELSGLRYTATVSRFADGRIGELFLTNHKGNSSADTAARDAAIAFSFAVQHGADPRAICRALCRDARGRAASPLGAALDFLLGDEL